MTRSWFDDPMDLLFDDVIEVHPGLRWVGPIVAQEQAQPQIFVQGYDLTGAMVYLAPEGVRWTSFSEPSQIDPSLPVKGGQGNQPTYYARSYHDLAPEQRRAYLAWLAGGRRDPEADRSFVRLYVYGLERRLLIDGATTPLTPQELHAIASELIAIEQRYHARMHSGFLDTLLAVVSALLLPPGEVLPYPPPIDPLTWEEPYLLRYGLGRFAMLNRPIPADWAAVWAWYRRDIVIRSALLYTTEEFATLFAHYYGEQCGEGLTFRPGKRQVSIAYHANNLTIGTITIPFPGVPEIYSRPSAGQKLRAITEQVWSELGPYARAVSRVYRSDKTLATASLLPTILQTRDRPEVDEALRWVEDQLGDASTMHIPEEHLVDLWWPRSWDGSPAVQQLAAKDRKSFITLLGRFGFGVEPDARYGKRPGTPPTNDGLAIFRAEEPVPGEPGKAWNSAVVAAQFGAAIVAQDGTFDETEAAHLAIEVADTFRIHPTEAIRLQITLRNLATRDDPVKITGMKPFLDPLTPNQCDGIVAFVLDVAARHGTVSPAVVSLVQKIARTLGLDPKEMPSRLFAAMSGSGAPSPRNHRGSGSRRSGGRPRELTLDRAAIAATEAATAAVADLLGDLLTDETHPIVPVVPEPPTIPDAHSSEPVSVTVRLIEELGSALVWTAAEFAALAARHGLMPQAALDLLNDLAFEEIGDPFLIEEVDGSIAVDREILPAMRAMME